MVTRIRMMSLLRLCWSHCLRYSRVLCCYTDPVFLHTVWCKSRAQSDTDRHKLLVQIPLLIRCQRLDCLFESIFGGFLLEGLHLCWLYETPSASWSWWSCYLPSVRWLLLGHPVAVLRHPACCRWSQRHLLQLAWNCLCRSMVTRYQPIRFSPRWRA